MFEFTFRNVKIRFHFGFFATVAVLMVSSNSLYTHFAFCSCILHEMGHLVAMIFTKEPISQLAFCGTGIKLVQKRNESYVKFEKEALILASGCLVNFCLFIAFISSSCYNVAMFGATNLLIGIFNLLPFSFLDGGKLLNLTYFKILRYETAVKLEHFTDILSLIVISIAVILLIYSGFENFTVYLTLIYLLVSTIIL